MARPALVVLVALAGLGAAFAPGAPAALAGQPASAAAAADPAVAQGREALRTGRYEQAVRRLEPAARRGGLASRVAAARLLARAHVATGDYDGALAALDAAGSAAPDPAAAAVELATTRGDVLRRAGRRAEAGAAYRRAMGGGASDALTARLGHAELLLERGEREQAFDAFDGFIDAYNSGRAEDAASLAAVAGAVARLGVRDPQLLHDAVRAYEEAMAADPAAPGPRIRLGELFLSRYDGTQAQALIRDVLERNPRDADALTAMARAKRFEGSAEAVELVDRALEVNPRHTAARTLRGLLLLEQGDDEGAAVEAGRALDLDSAAIPALAVRAAARFLSDDTAGYEADQRRALALNPGGGGFHTTIADIAVRRARYRQAVELAGRAVQLDPLDWAAWSILGLNQLRIAELTAARASLERAFEGDPFNPWTKNTLDLMDRLDGFRVVRTAHFELVMDPDEAELLEPYVTEIAEAAYATLSRRYGYRPDTPVRLEVYPRHADFSVRTLGVPGLPALGVAFGNVLAMNSPAAREPGDFHWGSTLWHEVAHAVTLGMTGHRVPRWLTEGISVREERRSRPGWGGPASLDFLLALHREMLLPMDRIDEGFVRPSYPGQVAVSYQHASWIVEFIEREHGEAAVRRMLGAYARGADTEAVFRDVLGSDMAGFDAAFLRDARERFRPGLAAVAGMEAEQGDVAGPLAERARSRPDRFGLQLAAGAALVREGRLDDAVPFLDRARSLFPDYVAPGSPYHLLAEVHRQRGDDRRLAEVLGEVAARDEAALATHLELAEVLDRLGATAGAADALERAILIHPYDPGPHERLAELAAAEGRAELEVRERRAVVALRPADMAGALYRLALAHRRAGDADAARRAVLRALETAPDFAEAQDLLLDLSEGT